MSRTRFVLWWDRPRRERVFEQHESVSHDLLRVQGGESVIFIDITSRTVDLLDCLAGRRTPCTKIHVTHHARERMPGRL